MTGLRITSYRLRRDLGTLAESKGRLAAGDILLNGRVIILHCPKCGALQFTAREVTGHDDAPNILSPVQCGAGFCRRCGVWFRIANGTPELVAAPESKPTAVSGALAQAGVFMAKPIQ